ncbi:hypothetical protein [Undibacterium sp. CY21W]|uniref:hypothetical protein n=1 Tax=Undibacterium sp. CY21W TaxID=2762293 RepID=UPI00164B99DD|nr:hypothetical protein [Undibacterium sp. CY21W]MBC3927720.1 hypothetical protein [Undibacterium sp. CY21W]
MSTAHERATSLSFSIIQSDSKTGRYARLPELFLVTVFTAGESGGASSLDYYVEASGRTGL